jgi:hypothetical protein
MTMITILSQVGFLPYIALVMGTLMIVAYSVGSSNLTKNTILPVNLLLALAPTITAIAITAFGFSAILRDDSFSTYCLLTLSIALCYVALWGGVLLKEGIASPSIQELCRKTSRAKSPKIRIAAGVMIIILATLLYMDGAQAVVGRSTCNTPECALVELLWARNDTILGPLLFAGVLNSFVISSGTVNIVSVWLAKYTSMNTHNGT